MTGMTNKPSASDARSFWSSVDVGEWDYYRQQYNNALCIKSSTLPEIEYEVWNVLEETIKRREPRHMTTVDYCKLVDWKLQRGKFRPSLKGFAKRVYDSEMKGITTQVFQQLRQSSDNNTKSQYMHVQWEQQLKNVLEPLLSIKGCGPATASAIVGMMDDSWPFMSDELLELAMDGERKYTKNMYVRLMRVTRDKANALSSALASTKTTATEKPSAGEKNTTDTADENVPPLSLWTARDVERAAFAFMMGVERWQQQAEKAGNKNEPGKDNGKKRKRQTNEEGVKDTDHCGDSHEKNGAQLRRSKRNK